MVNCHNSKIARPAPDLVLDRPGGAAKCPPGRFVWIRIFGTAAYLISMVKAFEFCIPTRAKLVPSVPDWILEIKHDGYRLRVEREGNRVRLITRNSADWTKRYPWIVEAALKNRQKQFILDGEAVVLGVDGFSDFDALHSGKHNDEVQFYAFDMLAGDGEDRSAGPTWLGYGCGPGPEAPARRKKKA